MTNLKELTIDELQQLTSDIKAEISLREAEGDGFYKEFNTGSKAFTPATYKQIQYAASLAGKTGSIIDTSTSQLLKYFEMDEMGEAIDLMLQGKRIRIS